MHCGMRAFVVVVMFGNALVAAPSHAQTGAPQVPPGYEPAQPTPYDARPAPYGAQPQPAPPARVLPLAPPVPQARLVLVERTGSIRGLWLPGLIVLPVAWVTTWTVSSSAFVGDAATFSWIPVIGPWLMLTQDLNGNDAGIILSGVVQGVSALALILGLSIKRTWTEQEYVIDPATGATARVTFDAISLPGGGLAFARVEL